MNTRIARGAEVAIRLLLPAGAVEQAPQLQMRGLRRLRREARLEIALRLSPKLLLETKSPERKQQRRVARMAFEPALGALQALERIGIAALAE